MIMPAVQKPHWKALRGEEGLLHRMQARCSRSASPSMVVDTAAGRPERGIDAAMHRLAVDRDGAGAAIAGIAPFFDTEPAEFPQDGAQALSRAGRLTSKRFAVDLEAHAIVPEFVADGVWRVRP